MACVSEAADRAEDLNSFEHTDFMALSYPDNTFGRPGGRISFSDFSLGSPGDPARVARFILAGGARLTNA